MKLTLLLLLFIPMLVCADDVTLTWTNPTGTEECTAGPLLTNRAGTRIWQLVADINDPDVEVVSIPGMLPGSYDYVATTYDDAGVGSRISGTATKVVTAFVTIDPFVKVVTKIPGDFLLFGVGTVPLGTVCDPAVSIKGHYSVPFDDINWSDPARNAGTAPLPLIVVVKCG